MYTFLQRLRLRNTALYYTGGISLIAALGCAILITLTNTQVLGINAWIKPMKFFLSITIFVWTMGWLMYYLERPKTVTAYTWMTILVFGIELIYITAQAAIGELSHFNKSTVFNGSMFGLMGILITILTLWTAYIGYLFFRMSFPDLPKAYVWGIRLGILLFVIFAFEGGLMVSQLAHTVGAADGADGLPILNWSTKYGDLRVAHFFGMHALQILPLTAYYCLRKTTWVILFAIGYTAFVSWLLLQALGGIPFLAF